MHHDVAERAYARVIALAPAAADGYLGAAESWLLASKFEAARVQAQKVVEATIGDAHAQATAHQLLARAALGRRRFDSD